MEENKSAETNVGKAVLEGTVGYKIELSGEEYGLKFDRTVDSELLCMMVVRELMRYNKEVLRKSAEQSEGKADKRKREQIKDRLKKIGGAEYILQFMIEGVIGELLEGGDLDSDEKLKEFDRSGITPEGLADSLLKKPESE